MGTKDESLLATRRKGSGVLVAVPEQHCSARVCLLPAVLCASTARCCCLGGLLAPTDQDGVPSGKWAGPEGTLHGSFSPLRPSRLPGPQQPRAPDSRGQRPPPSTCSALHRCLLASATTCTLNYHDSGYTNSGLHLQSSHAHELARPRSRVRSRSVRNSDNRLLKQCNRYRGVLNCR